MSDGANWSSKWKHQTNTYSVWTSPPDQSTISVTESVLITGTNSVFHPPLELVGYVCNITYGGVAPTTKA